MQDLLREDGIDAIRAINAWIQLDMMTLKNTSQLYFDITLPGQPKRLYRLVPAP